MFFLDFPVLTVPPDRPLLQYCTRCRVPAVLSLLSCPNCPVYLSCVSVLSRMPCPVHALAFRPTCPRLSLPTVLSPLYPALGVLSWLSCHAISQVILSCLSSHSYPVCAVMLWPSSPLCPAVMLQLSCPSCPVLAVLSQLSWAVLTWQSCKI